MISARDHFASLKKILVRKINLRWPN